MGDWDQIRNTCRCQRLLASWVRVAVALLGAQFFCLRLWASDKPNEAKLALGPIQRIRLNLNQLNHFKVSSDLRDVMVIDSTSLGYSGLCVKSFSHSRSIFGLLWNFHIYKVATGSKLVLLWHKPLKLTLVSSCTNLFKALFCSNKYRVFQWYRGCGLFIKQQPRQFRWHWPRSNFRPS